MYLQNDYVIAKLCGLTFYSHRQQMPSYFQFDATALVGWTDGVAPKRNATVRPATDGDFPETAQMGSRLITMTGGAVADSPQTLSTMRDNFVGMLADGQYYDYSVTDVNGTRYASVGLGGQPTWVRQSDKTATWKIDLYAPDPRIYGTPRTVSISGLPAVGGIRYPMSYPIDYGVAIAQQGQHLTNAGNTGSWPTFVVAGDYFGGFNITDNLGNYIMYTGPVGLTSPVTIDSYEGTATQGGSDRSTFLAKRQWFSVPAQGTIQPSFIPIQAVNGWCDIIYRDTWI